MSSAAKPSSIFAGTTDIIGQFFGLQDREHLKQKATARKVCDVAHSSDEFRELISNLYGTIKSNWSGRVPSTENWRIERQTGLNPNNRSPEVLLERAIAIVSERGLLGDWYNQIPVASGLIDDRADKRAAIDLLRYRENQAAFVELKWASDTPVFAAIEILLYGLAFIFSIEHRNQLGYRERPLLDVADAKLEVLAPSEFYDGYNVDHLRRSLDGALHDLVADTIGDKLSMKFRFLSFPAGFRLPFADGAEVLQLAECETDASACKALVASVDQIAPIVQ